MAGIELDAQEWGVDCARDFPFPFSLFTGLCRIWHKRVAAIELDAQEWGVKYARDFPFPFSLFPGLWAGSDFDAQDWGVKYARETGEGRRKETRWWLVEQRPKI